jgi:hypothetical protein
MIIQTIEMSIKKFFSVEKLTQNKKYTTAIGQNNSNVRHYLGRQNDKTDKGCYKINRDIKYIIINNVQSKRVNGYEFFQKLFLSIFN